MRFFGYWSCVLVCFCQGLVIRPSSSSNKRLHPIANMSAHDLGVERRHIFLNVMRGVVASTVLHPQAACARWILDEETGEYVEVQDVDWQTAWKERLDKASNMSQEEIFSAARGAGNKELSTHEEESPASRKRRALSACRSPAARIAAKAGNEKECTVRVLQGDIDFMLNAN